MFRIRTISLIVGCALVGQLLAADPSTAPLYSTDNLQGTKSVMIRHTGPATADAPAAGSTVPVANTVPGSNVAPTTSPRMIDKNVQQASANELLGSVAAAESAHTAGDAADTASAAASQAATDLLNRALEPPKDSPLPGHTLTLLAAITPFGSSRNAQLAIARAYWKLSAAEGDYNWAVEEADQLDHVTAGAAAIDAAVLATARASTQARLLEAKLGAVTAQQELADALGIPPNNPLPLASDPPLVGAYRTYFETLYATRVPPPRMRLIDRTLPIRREAIETHAAAVQAAASAVHAADEARAKSQADLQNLLTCEADLSRQRRSFLAAVRDYNLDIDEYALTVAEPSVPTDRVIGMLIRVKPAAAPSTSIVQPPTGEPTPARPSSNDALMQPALPSGTRSNAPPGATGAGTQAPSSKTPAGGPSGSLAPPDSTVPNSAVPNSAVPNSAAPNSAAPTPAVPSNPATVTNPFAAPSSNGPTTPAPAAPAPTIPPSSGTTGPSR